MSKTHAITGAFGYTGKYITQRLLAKGEKIITLTGNPKRPNPYGNQIQVFPFNFDNPEILTDTLRGIDTLFNTYWVRFDHGDNTFEKAVANTQTLFRSAQAAGVRRIVHVSITNPSPASPLPYFRGKAQLEQSLRQSETCHAILRPTVIFGREDILVNNIAYLLRRFPIFTIPGDGAYKLQPIYVEDMAALAIQASQMDENIIWDTVGPETFRFDKMVEHIRTSVGSRSRLVHTPPQIALTLSRFVGNFVKDVVLTQDEVDGLMAGLLISTDPPKGRKSFLEWLQENRDSMGRHYASELARHYQG